MRPPAWLVVVLLGAAIGIVFAGLSTYDFVQHLDRQVHSLHCSFIPGMTHDAGTSGCQVAMMSPYSSVFRTHVWGGIPIALPAMAVFAFIGCFALDLLVTRRKDDARATLFLVAAAALPALSSLVMLTISLTKLGTTCKLCVCIYIASALVLAGAIGSWRRAVGVGRVGTSKGGSSAQLREVDASPASPGFLAGMFGLGVAFVVVPVVLYLTMAPDNSKFIGTCENISKFDDPYGVMVHVAKGAPGAAPALEILDPLCPACRAFEDRLQTSGYADKLDRKAILFPLDSSCNWMITETTHPGACTISEAVLCAGERAPEVLAWAFEVQDQIRADTAKDPAAAARYVKAKFPDLAACVGSPDARSRLNKSLRWAVNNNIHVLTPQLFVDNVKLCDEDVDLGLEYALSIMLDRHAKGTLVPAPGSTPPASAPALKGDDAHDKSDRHSDSKSDSPASDRSNTKSDSPASDRSNTKSDSKSDKSDTKSDSPASDKTNSKSDNSDSKPDTKSDGKSDSPASDKSNTKSDSKSDTPVTKPDSTSGTPVTKPSDTGGSP